MKRKLLIFAIVLQLLFWAALVEQAVLADRPPRDSDQWDEHQPDGTIAMVRARIVIAAAEEAAE